MLIYHFMHAGEGRACMWVVRLISILHNQRKVKKISQIRRAFRTVSSRTQKNGNKQYSKIDTPGTPRIFHERANHCFPS